jgi:GT2 family glycosyltransferase
MVAFERIRKFVEEKRPSSVRVKFVRSDANRGYAGGMNLGWEAKDPETKYVAFLNNDLIVEPNSLKELIDYMESDDKLAAVSGLVYLGNSKRIYSAGDYVTDHWIAGGVCGNGLEHECPGISKPHYVTYAEGAYMLVNAEIVRRACLGGKPFIDETFLYLDNALLGLMLWNKGYRTAYIPIKSGYHYANLTTKPVMNYYGLRANTALIMLLDTRFSWIKSVYLLKRDISYKILRLFKGEYGKAYQDGIRLAQILGGKIGFKLDLHKAPYVKIGYLDFILFDFMMFNCIYHKLLIIIHEMLTNPQSI